MPLEDRTTVVDLTHPDITRDTASSIVQLHNRWYPDRHDRIKVLIRDPFHQLCMDGVEHCLKEDNHANPCSTFIDLTTSNNVRYLIYHQYPDYYRDQIKVWVIPGGGARDQTASSPANLKDLKDLMTKIEELKLPKDLTDKVRELLFDGIISSHWKKKEISHG